MTKNNVLWISPVGPVGHHRTDAEINLRHVARHEFQAQQDLSVLVHLEPPIGHGLSQQKAGSPINEVRALVARRLGGAITPKNH